MLLYRKNEQSYRNKTCEVYIHFTSQVKQTKKYIDNVSVEYLIS